MYDWNIIDCDFIQLKMNLNPKLTSLTKIGFKYIEFVENAQSEESAIYFKENKFGEDVPIKKKEQVWQVCIFSCCVIYPSTRTYIVPDQDGYRMVCFCTNFIRNYLAEDPKTLF